MVDDGGGNAVVAGAGESVRGLSVADDRADVGVEAILLDGVDDRLEVGAPAREQHADGDFAVHGNARVPCVNGDGHGRV